MPKTFPKGGVHPPSHKLSSPRAIEVLPPPERVHIPLLQHIGAPATPVVAKGDRVRVGDLIAQGAGFVSANIHASVSGTVAAIEPTLDTSGYRRPAISIAVEGDEWNPAIDRSPTLVKDCPLAPEAIVARVREAGVVGLGGATFPSHIKLTVPKGKKAEALIINGTECEPYLTADHRLMLERADELMVGATLIARALSVSSIYVGVENNKPDALLHLRGVARLYPPIEVKTLAMKYPQGGEKMLIRAITGREVPSGGLPIDVGCVVHNVGTALAVYEAVQKGKPMVERVVTVTGRWLGNPSNLLVRLGTPVARLIEAAGSLPPNTGKVIHGGPMMGKALTGLEVPVTKGTSGIVLLARDEALRGEATPCIRCARCVAVCPMGLEPYLINRMAQKRIFDRMEAERVMDCLECGSCSFACPAHLPLLDYIRLGKAEVAARARAKRG